MVQTSTSESYREFKSLGHKGNAYEGLETFKAPSKVVSVLLTSDEVTAVCPVTGQPDWYKVEVEYKPSSLCIESKTFKLFLQTLRDKGVFCEQLSEDILNEVVQYTSPKSAKVTVTQKPRGGVSIVATAEHKGSQ